MSYFLFLSRFRSLRRTFWLVFLRVSCLLIAKITIKHSRRYKGWQITSLFSLKWVITSNKLVSKPELEKLHINPKVPFIISEIKVPQKWKILGEWLGPKNGTQRKELNRLHLLWLWGLCRGFLKPRKDELSLSDLTAKASGKDHFRRRNICFVWESLFAEKFCTLFADIWSRLVSLRKKYLSLFFLII